MSEFALIIFVKNLEPGHVNQKLVETVGPEKAVEVYRDLSANLKEIAEGLRLDRFVFYNHYVPDQDDLWDNVLYERGVQNQEVLTKSAAEVFHDICKHGYEKVVLVTDDAAELTAGVLEQAYEALDEVDVVVGPAKNGSVYLLGLNEYDPELFESFTGKSIDLFDHLVDKMIAHRLIWHELPILPTPETADDLDLLRIRKFQREVMSH